MNDRMSGRRVRCQHCDAVIQVPEAQPSSVVAAAVLDAGAIEVEAVRSDDVVVETVEAVEVEALEPTGSERVEFAHDPVFDSPGHHHATDMPTLPPSMQAEDGDDDPPKRTKRKEDELDMTPMVDVTFLLLIFFMVTASFSLQKSMSMPRQQSDLPSSAPQEEPEEEPDMVTVQIDEFGSFLVMASDWERETPGKQNLISALREAMAPFSGAVTLSIEVHEEAKLRYLVDCMDAGAICSFAEVKITQVDGFD
ncbi:MAG TPA: biopolymer transporter ExbD [Planctomycetaceae bacterium]|nr:biopolymer transporter ExbD [Planctomycetaceae bacterium]